MALMPSQMAPATPVQAMVTTALRPKLLHFHAFPPSAQMSHVGAHLWLVVEVEAEQSQRLEHRFAPKRLP
jgi:hypothetical protein